MRVRVSVRVCNWRRTKGIDTCDYSSGVGWSGKYLYLIFICTVLYGWMTHRLAVIVSVSSRSRTAPPELRLTVPPSRPFRAEVGLAP
jgi:hypothetical protein